MFVGIDPGLTGAVCVLDESGQILSLDDMPIMKEETVTEVKVKRVTKKPTKAKAKKKKVDEYVDGSKLFSMVGTNNQIMIEKVSARPKQGVVSTFNFGKVFGAIAGVCSINNNVSFSRPAEWQKYFGVTQTKQEKEGKSDYQAKKEHKQKIAEKALELYPDADLYTPRGALKDGRSDALLVARYLYEKQIGNK